MKQANSPETAVSVFVKRNHQFACGATHPFILVCKMTPDWNKQVKTELKGDKKLLIAGKGYYDEGTATVQVTPSKGTAKIDKVNKEAKSLFKKAKLAFALASGVVQPKDENEEQEEPKVSSSAPESTTDQPQEDKVKNPRKEAQKEQGRKVLDKMLNNLKTLSERLNKKTDKA